GPHSVPGAPEPEENIAINVSSHTTLIVGHGTAGGLMLDQQSGDLDDVVSGELEIFKDGRLKVAASRIVMEEIEVVEGDNGPEERVVEAFDFGTFGEVTGRTTGDDDDNIANDDDDAVGDDDDNTVQLPSGCEGCSVSASQQPNGNWLISFVLAGTLAAGRRRRVRIEKAA
ncbi:MAG: hypothetical protein U1D98_01430, partial [Candidatus Gracilibacteria bacterium]|nr:hypothetical protein [Candidatus Gracilibacteria bacterium]